jgi:hypothetical protein
MIGIFKTDLRFADEQRKRLDKYFYPPLAYEGRFVALDRSPGSIYIQRHCHVDCIVASKRGGSVAIEEKITRYKGREYSAITIETHSNLARNPSADIGDGWITTSVADYLLYAFQCKDGRLRVNVFSLPELREWFIPMACSFQYTDTRNTHYVTRCRIVDLSAIPSGVFVIREKLV